MERKTVLLETDIGMCICRTLLII